jgi:hypothetical protein
LSFTRTSLSYLRRASQAFLTCTEDSLTLITGVDFSASRLRICESWSLPVAEKKFIMEILFINWLADLFLPKVNERRKRFHEDGPVIIVLDGHDSPRTSPVIA